MVSSAPAAAPYSIVVPLQRITSAVKVQITIVSVNTSNIPNIPCFTGFLVSAHAWAIEPVPSPASLEKIPRETPFFILVNMLPTMPPVTADGLNAPSKIEANTVGIVRILIKTTPTARTIYNSAIKGTSFSVTFPIRFTPPNKMSATSAAMTIPMIKLEVDTASLEIT